MKHELPRAARQVLVAEDGRFAVLGDGYLWRSDRGVAEASTQQYGCWLGDRLLLDDAPIATASGRLFRLVFRLVVPRDPNPGLQELDPDSLEVLRVHPVFGFHLAAAQGRVVVGRPLSGPPAARMVLPGAVVLDLEGVRQATHGIGEVQALQLVGERLIATDGVVTWVGPVDGPLRPLPRSLAAAPLATGWLLGTTVWSDDGSPDRCVPALHSVRNVDAVAGLPDGRVVVAVDRLLHVVEPEPIPRGPLRCEVRWVSTHGDHLAVSGSQGELAFHGSDGWRGPVPTRITEPPKPVWWHGSWWLGGRMDGQGVLQAWSTDARLVSLHQLPDQDVRHLATNGEHLLVVCREAAWVLDREHRVVAGPWAGEDLQHGALHPDGTAVVCSKEGQVLVDGGQTDLHGVRACFSGTGDLLLLCGGTASDLHRWPLQGRALRSTLPFHDAVPSDSAGREPSDSAGREPSDSAGREPYDDGVLWCEGRRVGRTTADHDDHWQFHDDVRSVARYQGQVISAHRFWLGRRTPELSLEGSLPMALGPRASASDCDGGWLVVAEERALVVWRLDEDPRVAWVWDGTALTGDPERAAYASAVRICDGRLVAWLHGGLHTWDIADPGSLRVDPDVAQVQWITRTGTRARRSDWESHHVVDLETGTVLLEVPTSSARGTVVRLAEDGDGVLVAEPGDDQSRLTWWSVRAGGPVATLRADASFAAVFLADDAKVYLMFSADDEDGENRFMWWDPIAERVERWLPPNTPVSAAGGVAVNGGVAAFYDGRAPVTLLGPDGTSHLCGVGHVQNPPHVFDEQIVCTSFEGWNTRFDRRTGRIDRFLRAVDGTVRLERA